MINQFQKIKSIGCYDDYTFIQKKIEPFGKINILYGSNGSGKTTFSNLLFLLSKHCKEKEQLISELIDKDSELEIITSSGKVTHKNISEKNLDLYVFNSKFVTDHVYNGTRSNVDSFSNDVKLTSPEIEKIDSLIKQYAERNKKLSAWSIAIDLKLEAIFKLYNEEFQKKISGSRLTGVKPTSVLKKEGDLSLLKSELNILYTEYSNKSKEASTIESFTSLIDKFNSIANIDIDVSKTIKELSIKVSSEAKGRIGAKVESFQKEVDEKKMKGAIGDLNYWFKIGGRLLHLSKEQNKKCPLCDTDLSLSLDSIINEYSNYFSDSLMAFVDLVQQNIETLSNFINNDQVSKNESAINELINQCQSRFNFDIGSLIFNKDDGKLLIEAVDELLSFIKKKKENPELELSVSEEKYRVIDDYINAVNMFKSAALLKVEERISELKGKSIDVIVKEIKNKIGLIVSVELNQKENNIYLSSKKRNSDIAIICHRVLGEIKNKIDVLEQNKTTEIAKLNNESKYINIYLKHLGISHFEIDRDKTKEHDNLMINYKSGKRKIDFKHSLSEGEKTALAFSYFISKLRVEKIEGSLKAFKDCVIVIDDPISSLDDNRLFQTANLIDSFLFYSDRNLSDQERNSEKADSADNHPCQVFILSHNLTFVKYLHNALRANENLTNSINEYYLTTYAPKINKLPSGLKNFTNTYIVKLKEIVDFKEKRTEYNIVKNYLPNYIRIVLETFLSFKLALVNDSQGRLPGLSHLINAIVKEFESIGDVEYANINKDGAIKRLNHLKKIADHESHGSIFRAEEFSFISEVELKEFAKYAVQVIEYIDNLHFRRVKAHV